MTKNKNAPKFSLEQIKYLRHLFINAEVKIYKECCVLREFEIWMKKIFEVLLNDNS